MRELPALAAYSHSTAVGRRPPAHRQKAVAWCQSTLTTGWSDPPSLLPGPLLQPPAATQVLYCATVVSVCAIDKGATRWVEPGRSSLSHSLS